MGKKNFEQNKAMQYEPSLGCVFCHGTGMATFVDMDKVPD